MGVLKGLAKDYFKFDMTVELLSARGKDEGADHEVWRGGGVEVAEHLMRYSWNSTRAGG